MENALESIDQDLLVKINSWHNQWLDVLMWQFSELYIFLPLALLLLYFYHKRFQLRNTIALLLGCGLIVACTDISSNFVKHHVKRYRPTHNVEIKEKLHVVKEYRGGKYGFVSSHAANTAGVTAFLFLAANWLYRGIRILFFLVPLVIMYSRIYLGVHYPSDVFVGGLLGIFFGYLIFMFFKRYLFREIIAEL